MGQRARRLGIEEAVRLPAFGEQADQALRRLGLQHLRISLFRLGADRRGRRSVASVLDRLPGYAGRLPDGTIGFLYIGPRPQGPDADRRLTETIEHRLRTDLAARPPQRQPAVTIDLSLHRWSDEIVDATVLLDELGRLPVRSPGRDDPVGPSRARSPASATASPETGRAMATRPRILGGRPWHCAS